MSNTRCSIWYTQLPDVNQFALFRQHSYRLRKYSEKNYTVQMEQILEGKKASKVDEYFYCLLFCRQCQYVLTCPVSIHFSKERKKRKFSKTERPAIVDLWHDMQVFSSLLTISSDEYIETLKENTDKSKVLFFSLIFCVHNNSYLLL